MRPLVLKALITLSVLAVLVATASNVGASPLRPLVIAVGVAAAVVLVSLRTSHRDAPRAGGSVLRVTARAGLGGRASLALVEVSGRRVLVAFGEGFATLMDTTEQGASLDERSWNAPAPAPELSS